jgi:hypothetical protein
LNAAAFAEPAPSTLGTSGRNEFRGPGFYSLDLSLARSFPASWLGENGRMTLRAALFNVLNHANFVGYSGTYGNGATPGPGFGAPLAGITNQLAARSVQFSAKFSF